MKRTKVKGGIFGKMMKAILLPLIALLLVVGMITLELVQDSLMKAKATELQKIAELGSSRVETYFTKYRETARQMATDLEIRQMMTDLKMGQAVADAKGFPAIKENMIATAANDPGNISVAWLADFDASQCAEGSGYATEVGEWDVTSRVWYSQVLAAKDVVVTEPYENSSSHSLVVSVLAPVWSLDGSEILGVAGVDLNLDQLQATVSDMAFGDTGAMILISGGGMIVGSPIQDMIQKASSEVYEKAMADKISAGQAGAASFIYSGKKYEGCVCPVENVGWTIVTQLSDSEYVNDYYIMKNTIFALFMLAIAALIVGNVLVAKSIIRPITGLANVAEEIAEGNLEVKMDLKAKGEPGLVANALQKTIGRLKDYIIYRRNFAGVEPDSPGGFDL